jgi:hypothetical protein
MGVKLPRDPQERIRVMLKLMRGEDAEFVVDGEKVRLTPRRQRQRPRPSLLTRLAEWIKSF